MGSAADTTAESVEDRLTAPVPWLSDLWQRLLHDHRQEKLAHAILMQGEPGVGRNQTALAFAQLLLCESPGNGLPCGHCKTCQLNRAGTHPDLLLIGLEEKSTQIKVDQIRQVVDFVGKKAQLGGYRVVIISPAEAMNTAASNALLKSLEEPGERTLLLLVAQGQGSLLATIRSRCQLMHCPTPARATAATWLQSLLHQPTDCEHLLAAASNAPLRALALEHSSWFPERVALARGWIDVALGRREPVAAAAAWVRFPLSDLLGCWYRWQVELARMLSGGEATVTEPEIEAALRQLVPALNPVGLIQAQDDLLATRIKLRSVATLNSQLLLEALLMKWARVLRA